MRCVVKTLKAIFRRILLFIFFFFPVKKNRVVVSCFNGGGYSDNPKYIAEKLLEYNKFEIIWLVKNINDNSIPSNIKKCLVSSYKAIYYLCTAGIWIDNCRKAFFYKKKNTLYIQTWHGGGAQKRVEKDVVENLGPNYEKMAKKDSKQIDLFLSDSAFMTKLCRNSFWYDDRVLELGYPRYDGIFKAKDKTYFLKTLNLKSKDKLILYAPTFRKNHSLEVYNLDIDSVIKSFSSKFGVGHKLLLRLHPNISFLSKKLNLGPDVIDVTDYPDFQDLVVFCDYVITDYSSVAFDFALLNKPSFRYAPDFEDYKKDRNFYFNFEEYPYPYALDNKGFSNLICNFDQNVYMCNVKQFLEKIGFKNLKNCSEIVASIIHDYSINRLTKDKLFDKYSGYINMPREKL